MVSPRARAAVSQRVFASFSIYGVGVCISGGLCRAPLSFEEVERVPAFAAVLRALGDDHSARLGGPAPVLEELRRAPPAALGFFVLLLLRHAHVHVLHDPELASLVRGSGLTGAIVAEAVTAAAEVLVQQQRLLFRVGSDGGLRFITPPRSFSIL